MSATATAPTFSGNGTDTRRRGVETGTGARPTYEMIARRAYQIYLERGSRDGHHEEDWLEAERQLTMEMSRKSRE